MCDRQDDFGSWRQRHWQCGCPFAQPHLRTAAHAAIPVLSGLGCDISRNVDTSRRSHLFEPHARPQRVDHNAGVHGAPPRIRFSRGSDRSGGYDLALCGGSLVLVGGWSHRTSGRVSRSDDFMPLPPALSQVSASFPRVRAEVRERLAAALKGSNVVTCADRISYKSTQPVSAAINLAAAGFPARL
jgi:hypothetical protein